MLAERDHGAEAVIREPAQSVVVRLAAAGHLSRVDPGEAPDARPGIRQRERAAGRPVEERARSAAAAGDRRREQHHGEQPSRPVHRAPVAASGVSSAIRVQIG